MIALVLKGPGRLEVTERPPPIRGVGQVLVQTSYAGVCATDSELISGALTTLPIGSIPGHEIAGRIVEGHPSLPPGARVVVDSVVSCGECELCVGGRRGECGAGGELGIDRDGGWAELVVVDSERVHELPLAIPEVEAPLIEPLVCPYGAVASEPAFANSRVAVFGSGVAALNFVQCARRFGAKSVDAVVRKDEDLFRLFGARCLVADVRELPERGEYDLVIDAVGSSETASWGPTTAGFGGRILLYGLADAVVSGFPLREAVLRNLTIVGKTNSPGNWKFVIDDVATGDLCISGVVDQRLTPVEVPQLFSQGKSIHRKSVVEFCPS